MDGSTASSAVTAAAARSSSSLDPERRSALLGVKLGALVRDHFGVGGGSTKTFPGGAALATDGRAFVLAEDEPERALGRAMAWAVQNDARHLDLLVEDAAGLLARQASQFVNPPATWWVRGREIHHVEPEPHAPPVPPDPRAMALVPLLDGAGADVVVEHGVVAGEVLGLEIARVVVDDDGARLEVGVGAHDREAFAMLHGDLPAETALARVIQTARQHRRPGDTDHPLRRLVPERWMRRLVLDQPELVGATSLHAVEGPRARTSVKETLPAFAVGTNPAGQTVVVAFSVGIDLHLVPAAADARLAYDPSAELVIVLPERDVHPVTQTLAASLTQPARIVPLPTNWRQ